MGGENSRGMEEVVISGSGTRRILPLQKPPLFATLPPVMIVPTMRFPSGFPDPPQPGIAPPPESAQHQRHLNRNATQTLCSRVKGEGWRYTSAYAHAHALSLVRLGCTSRFLIIIKIRFWGGIGTRIEMIGHHAPSFFWPITYYVMCAMTSVEDR